MRILWVTGGFLYFFIPSWSQAQSDSLNLPDLRTYLLRETRMVESYFYYNQQNKKVEELYPAFFCRMEHRWEKKTRIGSKFRLGSIDYVDYLESK